MLNDIVTVDEEQMSARTIQSLKTSDMRSNLRDAKKIIYQQMLSTLEFIRTFPYIHKVQITNSASNDGMTTGKEQINGVTRNE